MKFQNTFVPSSYFLCRIKQLVGCSAASLALGFQALGQSTLTIGFEGQAAGTAVLVQAYSEGGMRFTPAFSNSNFVRMGPNSSAFLPQNGTAYLQAGQGSSLAFSFTNGSLFSLSSVDLAEYSTVVPDSLTFHFIGYYANGSTVTTDLTTDGIIDGTGPLVDFQTFTFDTKLWTGLTRVEIPTYGWSLDNLVVTPAPEPGTIWLGVLGAWLLWAATRKIRKQKVES